MIRATGLLLALTLPFLVSVQDYGKYVGTVKTEWIDDGRHMRLLDQFSYIDPNGLEWVAPTGAVVDGASIPRFAWSLIGGPFEGKYRDASVIHDVACEQRTRPWEAVHQTFYYAMLASGVGSVKAKIMYAAVYHFGPRWSRTVETSVPSVKHLDAELSKILSGAVAGSEMEVKASTKYRSADNAAGESEAVYLTVVVAPPVLSIKESEFEQLKRLIEERESSAGPVSLEEIRKFKAQK